MKRLQKHVTRGKKTSVIKNMLSRGTIHGLKYLFDENTNNAEKLFWMVVFTAAFIGTAAHLFKVWDTYRTNLTRTTIISTYFKYTNVAFPSVTVCDSSRVDWSRVNNLNLSDFLDKYSDKNQSMLMSDFKMLLAALSTAQFGSPKDLNHVKNVYSLRSLNEVHISRLLRQVVRRCEQVFETKCWWRTNWYRCCDLFELQKTGYGYCYSFNSDISEKSKLLSLNYGLDGDKRPGWTDWRGQMRPRRTAGHGPWSGLRFSVRAQQIPHYVNVKPGVVVIVGDPSGFPFENDVFVGDGKIGHIGVRGDAVFTTDRLQKLPVSKRKCLFPDESRTLFRGYLRQNCIANCYRKFVQANCKCSLDFIYYQIPYNTNAFINHLSEESINNDYEMGSFCKCPDDCVNQKYIAKLFTRNAESSNKVLCDVHFERSFCSLYRTDISFDYMDALVSYGGIFGLFLGASLLSVAEIIYNIGKKILSYLPKKKKTTQNIFRNNSIAIFFKREFPLHFNGANNYE